MQLLTILALLALTIVSGPGPAHADERPAPVIGNATPVQPKIVALEKYRVARAAAPPAGSTGVMPWMAPLIEKDRGRIARIVETREKALAKAASSGSASRMAFGNGTRANRCSIRSQATGSYKPSVRTLTALSSSCCRAACC